MEELHNRIGSLDEKVTELAGSVKEIIALKNSLGNVGQIQEHLNRQDNDRKNDQEKLMLILNGDNTDPQGKPGLMQRVKSVEDAIKAERADRKSFSQNVRWFVGILAALIAAILTALAEQFFTSKK